jgi:hypothetical protein
MDNRGATAGGTGRLLLIFGTPIAYAVLTVVHPHSGNDADMYGLLRNQWTTWLGVHVVQIVLIILLGATVWALLDGITGRSATVARVAIWPFIAFYSAFDAVLGIGTGLLVRQANGLGGTAQAFAAHQIQQYFDSVTDPATPIMYLFFVGAGSWIVAVVAAAVALRRNGARWPGVVLLLFAGVLFGRDHVYPYGTAGMIAFFLAVLLLQRERAMAGPPGSATGIPPGHRSPGAGPRPATSS